MTFNLPTSSCRQSYFCRGAVGSKVHPKNVEQLWVYRVICGLDILRIEQFWIADASRISPKGLETRGAIDSKHSLPFPYPSLRCLGIAHERRALVYRRLREGREDFFFLMNVHSWDLVHPRSHPVAPFSPSFFLSSTADERRETNSVPIFALRKLVELARVLECS